MTTDVLFHESVLVTEYSVPNWNGERAEPVTRTTYDMAIEFIKTLPDDLPLPTTSCDPDGEISIDWDFDISGNNRNEVHMVSVSIGESGKLSYAGYYGPDEKERESGIIQFKNKVPDKIIALIRKIQVMYLTWKIEQLRSALTFYAEGEHFSPGYNGGGCRGWQDPEIHDEGEKAQEALRIE